MPKKKKQELSPEELAHNKAQDWIPIADIRGDYIYRKDGNVLMALRVLPFNLSLLNQREKALKINALTEFFNSERNNLQILCIGRPVDLRAYVDWQQSKLKEVTTIAKKRLLKNCIGYATKVATSGEVTERRFYVIICEANKNKVEEQLLDRLKELQRKLQAASLSAEICNEQDLTELQMLFAFPKQAAFEDNTYINYIDTTAYYGEEE